MVHVYFFGKRKSGTPKHARKVLRNTHRYNAPIPALQTALCTIRLRATAFATVHNWLCVLRVNASNNINERVFNVRSNKRLEHARILRKRNFYHRLLVLLNRPRVFLTHQSWHVPFLSSRNGHLGFSNPSINFISFIVGLKR